MSNLISCAQYDYFEIACMHHYELEITLANTKQVIGIAHNVKVIKEGDTRKEVLVLKIKDELISVELMDIYKMRALTDNPHFTHILIA